MPRLHYVHLHGQSDLLTWNRLVYLIHIPYTTPLSQPHPPYPQLVHVSWHSQARIDLVSETGPCPKIRLRLAEEAYEVNLSLWMWPRHREIIGKLINLQGKERREERWDKLRGF